VIFKQPWPSCPSSEPETFQQRMGLPPSNRGEAHVIPPDIIPRTQKQEVSQAKQTGFPGLCLATWREVSAQQGGLSGDADNVSSWGVSTADRGCNDRRITRRPEPPHLSLSTTPSPFSALRPLRGPERSTCVHHLARENRDGERPGLTVSLGRSGGQAARSLWCGEREPARQDIARQDVTAADSQASALLAAFRKSMSEPAE
jgi:hypothetical protein